MLLPRRGENVLRTGCVLLGTVVGKQTLETSFRRNVARRVAKSLWPPKGALPAPQSPDVA
jgi:hypothetical protein